METATRHKPEKLAQKLKQIRLTLELSQNGLLEKLGLKNEVFRSTISAFERGTREPSYIILLKYAKLAGICTDVLIDDALNLPEQLPRKPKHKQ